MRKPLSFEQRKRRLGMLFLLPWFTGFIFFFLTPLFQSLQFSFSKIVMNPSGFKLQYVGLVNYQKALTVHPTFIRFLTDSIFDMVVNVPIIIFFSLFAAVLLNQRFRGRAFARAVFFLPVILTSGVIITIQNGSFLGEMMSQNTSGGIVEGGTFRGVQFEYLLLESGVSPVIVDYLVGAVNRIYDIVSRSGVQILIFLAGLQAISPSLYEAAKIEGATGYESFWKITFPMISPLIITNVIFSIIDSFASNRLTKEIDDIAFKALDFGLSASMAWIYFGSIAVILSISSYLISKGVFYNE